MLSHCVSSEVSSWLSEQHKSSPQEEVHGSWRGATLHYEGFKTHTHKIWWGNSSLKFTANKICDVSFMDAFNVLCRAVSG